MDVKIELQKNAEGIYTLTDPRLLRVQDYHKFSRSYHDSIDRIMEMIDQAAPISLRCNRDTVDDTSAKGFSELKMSDKNTERLKKILTDKYGVTNFPVE